MKSVYQLFCPLLRLAARGQLAAAAAASLTAAICALGLMGAAAWLITSAALQPPSAQPCPFPLLPPPHSQL